jgi:F-type H+-transporting ATPase subunit a
MAHWIKYLLIVVFLAVGNNTNAQHHEEGATQEESAGFNPGPFIIEHIGDAYGWHIITVNGHHVSVPLPVIVYSRQSGFHCFLSSKLHHGEYQGLSIAGEDHPNKGKIVEQLSDGTLAKPLIDISITKNVLSLFVSVIILLWVFISVANRYKANPDSAPKGLQSVIEPFIMFIRDTIARPAIGHQYERFMPYLLTVFFFIFINNLMGLIPFFPFGANLTGNIAITLVLALLTFIITLKNSNRHYWVHIVNPAGVPWWLKIPIPLMPLIEFVGVLTKPFTLLIRLFANITAGHIIALSFFSLIFIFGAKNIAVGYGMSVFSVAFTVFMTTLELLVSVLQAYVFTLLSAIYFGGAIAEPHPKH